MKFSYLDHFKNELCNIRIEHFYADVYVMIRSENKNNIKLEVWLELITQALSYAKEKNIKTIQYRLIESEDSYLLSKRLPEFDFVKTHDRIEFRANLVDLPDDVGTPFQWNSVADLQWNTEDIAHFLRQVSKGDPGYDPKEDATSYIRAWLNDPVLNSGFDCISIGCIDTKPLALVVAQVNPKTAWSRISYMGQCHKSRNKGLGKWVQRRGFAMMRSQGGKLYHGGTSTANSAMLALFRHHNCKEYKRMEEWF